jgi:uncharacterized protein YdaU (DUF1376 family)
MSNGDRWMPLYVADYLGDTMHLTTLQHGAYVLLLMHYWKTGPLPDDEEALAAITKLDAKAWKGVWTKLSAFFTVNGDGTLHQKRMDSERQHWADLSEKRRGAGKRGAEAKHRSHPSNGSGPATPLPNPPQPQPQVIPKHVIPQPEPGNRLGKPVAIARDLPERLPEICQPISGNCQDFATDFASVPLPSKEESLLNLSSQKGAREAEPGGTGQNLPREPDHLEMILRESLQQADSAHKASLMSKQRKHTLDEQRAAVAKPRAKACAVIPAAMLASLRKQAGYGIAP